MIGSGQLARMSVGPAVELGLSLSVLATDPDDGGALAAAHAPVGHHADLDRVVEFARHCDVITFDHEHVPDEVLRAVEDLGVPMHPRPTALQFAQDKLAMRRRLGELAIPCPRWASARTVDDVREFGASVGWPIIAKTPRGGYDGKGVRLVSQPEDLADWFADGAEILLEEKVTFRRELAALVARSPSGQAAAWPVVETVQTDGICTEVLAPAPGLDPGLAAAVTEAALKIAGELDVTGVLAVELFEIGVDGPAGATTSFVVNELAMRPHNSGHWSMDGAVTGQFEQHLRAVLDLPLGDPRPRDRWTGMANVLGGDITELYSTYRHLLARDPALKVHLYGKAVRPGRKIGHVNVGGDDLDDLRERARHAADFIQGVIDE